jgi:transcription termination/antitermination protein NusA
LPLRPKYDNISSSEKDSSPTGGLIFLKAEQLKIAPKITKLNMFDLKVINAVLSQMEEERGIPKEKIIEAIEMALGTAYKKEYGKKGQIIKAKFNLDSGDVEFWQSKIVVEKDGVIMDDEEYKPSELKDGEEPKPRYNPEHHIFVEEARLIKKGAQVGDELTFPLEKKSDFGRIAAQTAKQVITQKIREAEKTSVVSEFGEREGEIISGTVERIERGTIYLDMGRAVGMLNYEEQIPGERFKQGERVRAYLFRVDETSHGVFLKLSRSHPKFLEELFRAEVPEIEAGTVQVKAIAREAGSRSKIAVNSTDEHVDPVGALVGQRGVRVSTIMSELGGEKIDIIEWSETPNEFIAEALSPAKIIEINTNPETKIAQVKVNPDQQSLAIGKGGQNVRLAAKLTGWKIDVISDIKKVEEEPKEEVVDNSKEVSPAEVTEETPSEKSE